MRVNSLCGVQDMSEGDGSDTEVANKLNGGIPLQEYAVAEEGYAITIQRLLTQRPSLKWAYRWTLVQNLHITGPHHPSPSDPC